MAPDEMDLWTKLATGAAGLCTALVSLVWADYRKRVDKVEAELDTKADKTEMDRQRDHIGKLFDKLEEHARRSEDGQRQIMATIHSNHSQVLTALAKKADK
jgi:hypothetical protein